MPHRRRRPSGKQPTTQLKRQKRGRSAFESKEGGSQSKAGRQSEEGEKSDRADGGGGGNAALLDRKKKLSPPLDEKKWVWGPAEEAAFQIQGWDDIAALCRETIITRDIFPPQLIALVMQCLKPTPKQLRDQEQKGLEELSKRFKRIKWAIGYKRSDQSDTDALAHHKQLGDSFADWRRRQSHLYTPKFREGQKVMGYWIPTKTWHDCQVRRVNQDGTYTIKYDDGAEDDEMLEKQLKLIKPADQKTKPTDQKGKSDDQKDDIVRQPSAVEMMYEFSHVLATTTPIAWRQTKQSFVPELESAFHLSFVHYDGSGESYIYCSRMFPLRPDDFDVAMNGLHKRYLELLPQLASWHKKHVEIRRNREALMRSMTFEGAFRDERELTNFAQEVMPKDWASDLYATWVKDQKTAGDFPHMKDPKRYGIFLVDTDPNPYGTQTGRPYFDGIGHIRVFPTTSFWQLASLISRQHEEMDKAAIANNRLYQELSDLTMELSKRLGNNSVGHLSVVPSRQCAWYEQNEYVGSIIEAFKALIHHADRIKAHLHFVSPTFEKKADDVNSDAPFEYQPRINAYILVVPPYHQKMQLESSCILKIPATFDQNTFDVGTFVAAAAHLIPAALVPQ